MGRKSISLLVASALAIVLMMGTTSMAAEATTTWKAQTLWSAAEVPHKAFVDFCSRVKTATNGRLEIIPNPAGTIVPTNEALDALKNNVIQAMNEWPGYWTGKNPAFAPLTDLILAYKSPWEADAFFHYRGGLELLRELYAPFGAYCVGVSWWGVESMPSKMPLTKIEDFKGIKIRSPQGMQADLQSRLGAAVVTMPGGEVYSALDKGVIEATDWGTASMNYRLGFFQVAKYFTYPGFHSMPVGDFTVNKKAWDKLPPDVQQIVTSLVREWCIDSIQRVWLDDMKAVKEMKEKGIEPIAWDDKELDRMRDAAMQVWDDWAKKNEQCKKAVDLQKAWLKEIGRIK